MDFNDRIQALVVQVPKQIERFQTGKVTNSALIMQRVDALRLKLLNWKLLQSHKEKPLLTLNQCYGRYYKLMIALILAISLTLDCAQTAAQEPYQIKDIYFGNTGSDPNWLTEANGLLFFTADDGIHGNELWKSDGTEAGTVMVKDINPDSEPSDPRFMVGLNGILFFTADDGIHGHELWKSDGTEAGTVMVKDIYPGNIASSPQYLTEINGTLFFPAYLDPYGYELWKSDGTEAGTIMVKNIGQGSLSSFTFIVGGAPFLTNVNGTLFFRASNGTDGQELWKSDGTEAGTVMVKNICPVGCSSTPRYLTNMNGILFFSAYDGANGYELWKSDGTEAGTVLVKDIGLAGDSFPSKLTAMNGILFFQANNCTITGCDIFTKGYELWKSDGTEVGTVMVKDINPGSGSAFLPGHGPLFEANCTLFFRADNGVHGRELWKSDGTEAGTIMVKDINSGSDSSFDLSGEVPMTQVKNMLFFSADDGISG